MKKKIRLKKLYLFLKKNLFFFCNLVKPLGTSITSKPIFLLYIYIYIYIYIKERHALVIGSVWIGLILLKLKTYCWNHCSKIIFKCVNSTMGPIFNEKIDKKWNLWVHEQCKNHCSLKKVNICGYCLCNSVWTVTAFLQKRMKKKK